MSVLIYEACQNDAFKGMGQYVTQHVVKKIATGAAGNPEGNGEQSADVGTDSGATAGQTADAEVRTAPAYPAPSPYPTPIESPQGTSTPEIVAVAVPLAAPAAVPATAPATVDAAEVPGVSSPAGMVASDTPVSGVPAATVATASETSVPVSSEPGSSVPVSSVPVSGGSSSGEAPAMQASSTPVVTPADNPVPAESAVAVVPLAVPVVAGGTESSGMTETEAMGPQAIPAVQVSSSGNSDAPKDEGKPADSAKSADSAQNAGSEASKDSASKTPEQQTESGQGTGATNGPSAASTAPTTQSQTAGNPEPPSTSPTSVATSVSTPGQPPAPSPLVALAPPATMPLASSNGSETPETTTVIDTNGAHPQKSAGGPTFSKFLDFLDFANITPEWVTARWSNVLSVGPLYTRGYRVPLCTGTDISDLIGSLTYYFDKNLDLEKITFEGYTGDLERLTTTLKYFSMSKRTTSDPNILLYETPPRKDGNRCYMQSYHRMTPVTEGIPNTRYHIIMELYPREGF